MDAFYLWYINAELFARNFHQLWNGNLNSAKTLDSCLAFPMLTKSFNNLKIKVELAPEWIFLGHLTSVTCKLFGLLKASSKVVWTWKKNLLIRSKFHIAVEFDAVLLAFDCNLFCEFCAKCTSYRIVSIHDSLWLTSQMRASKIHF